MKEQNGWIALKDAIPKENQLVQLISQGIDYDMKVFAERIGENFISLLTSQPIDLADESGIRWAYVATPAHPAAKSEPTGWTRFDWADKATHPEHMRKIWVVSDRVEWEDELVCYFDGNFFRNTEDWNCDEELGSGIRWCYVQRPPRPE